MNILAIGAHYDDLELGCSGTLIKHVHAGDTVILVVVTDSAYQNLRDNIQRTGEEAYAEGKRAAEVIGAELICLNHPTFKAHFDEDLTRQLLDIIEERNIDTIYSHWVHDLHRDHSQVARAALMAGRHMPRFLMYRSNFYDTETQFRGNLYSDITNQIDTKIEAIRAHRSELQRVRYKWIDFFKHQHRNDGMKIGVEYAEVFEIVRYLVC